MYNLKKWAKTAPSQYPPVPFHSLRLSQLVSSMIVAAVMSYFIWNLNHDEMGTPWTFVWLTTASCLSIAALVTTYVLYYRVGLDSRLNLSVNTVVALAWTVGWCLLTWFASGTLGHTCDLEHWNEAIGVMVCRLYKALYSFTSTGLLSTLAALGLDIYVRRQHTRLGIYQLQNPDVKRGPDATHGPFTDLPSGSSERRESGAWEEPRASIGPYSEQPSHTQAQSRGYGVPENQFEYDTAYRGHDDKIF